MAYEIIYVCNSINNKNVRNGELKILRKIEKELYFEFGETEMNIKKRFYNDIETLNKDFNELQKLKEKEENKVEEKEEIKQEEVVEKVETVEETVEEIKQETENKKTNKRKNLYN